MSFIERNILVTMKAHGPIVFLSGLCSVNYGWFNRMPGSVINSIILQLSIPWSDRVWENRLCWRSVALDWFHIKFSAELAPQKLLFRKGSNEMVNKSLSLNKLANQKTSARRKSCFLGTLLKVNCTCTSTYHY